MAKSLLRTGDMRTEREIAEYMNEKFYSKQTIITEYIRTDSIDSQMEGSDLVLSIPSLTLDKVVVDEKAASHYINKNIPSFAFELSFLTNSGQRVNGWIIDENKKTKYYMLMWISAKKDKNIHKDDITEIEYLLISRKEILKYLLSEGYSPKKLMEHGEEIMKQHAGKHELSPQKPFYFYYTDYLAEKPVNLIIRKPKLIEMASLYGRA